MSLVDSLLVQSRNPCCSIVSNQATCSCIPNNPSKPALEKLNPSLSCLSNAALSFPATSSICLLEKSPDFSFLLTPNPPPNKKQEEVGNNAPTIEYLKKRDEDTTAKWVVSQLQDLYALHAQTDEILATELPTCFLSNESADLDACKEWMQHSLFVMQTVEEKACIRAMALVLPLREETNEVFLHLLWVVPDERKNGLGSCMLNALKKMYSGIFLSSLPATREYYTTRHSFVQVQAEREKEIRATCFFLAKSTPQLYPFLSGEVLLCWSK